MKKVLADYAVIWSPLQRTQTVLQESNAPCKLSVRDHHIELRGNDSVHRASFCAERLRYRGGRVGPIPQIQRDRPLAFNAWFRHSL
jgi:hypothetical protein